jgi:hypothetical protein
MCVSLSKNETLSTMLGQLSMRFISKSPSQRPASPQLLAGVVVVVLSGHRQTDRQTERESKLLTLTLTLTLTLAAARRGVATDA